MDAHSSKDAKLSLASTLAFYQHNALDYAARTLSADLSRLYKPFLDVLPANARVLDAGCGAGRDLDAFSKRGLRVMGIDASSELVRIARANFGVNAIVQRLEDVDFENQFDGIWACASLLHLPKNSLDPTLLRLRRALVESGVLFVSIQEGSGEEITEDGRFFARYSQEEISDHIRGAGFQILETWITLDTLLERRGLSWINLLAKRDKTFNHT